MSIPRFLAAALFLMAALLPAPPQATAATDEEKQKAFLKADRRDSDGGGDVSGRKAADKESGGGESRSKASKTGKKKQKNSKSKPKPAAKKRHPQPEPEEAPHRTTEPEKQPTPRPPVTPAPIPAPESSVVVQKSGAVEEEPAPEPEERNWWWPFRHVRYKYLTHSVRRAIDDAHVARHRWRYIVVHNSGTRQGNAKAFDYYHRHVRKMPNGLAYHFVIGNGTSSRNGEIEIGPRWVSQINGGHVHSDYLNSIALGICLVGDYNRDTPTREQMEALDELIRYLRNRVGKTDHKLAIVKPHRDINPPQWPTDCPGEQFPYDWLNSHFGD